MNFDALPMFGLMKAKLGYMSERQNILAQNVANADTPDYKARDVAAPDFRKMAQSMGGNPGPGGALKMTATNPKHITHNPLDGQFTIGARKTTHELNPNGNNVVIEEEMANVAANQADYQKVLNLYAKTIAMFKIAIGRPGAA